MVSNAAYQDEIFNGSQLVIKSSFCLSAPPKKKQISQHTNSPCCLYSEHTKSSTLPVHIPPQQEKIKNWVWHLFQLKAGFLLPHPEEGVVPLMFNTDGCAFPSIPKMHGPEAFQQKKKKSNQKQIFIRRYNFKPLCSTNNPHKFLSFFHTVL